MNSLKANDELAKKCAKTINVKATLKPVNALCVLYGHDFDVNGKCRRNLPNLLDKTKPGGKCDGR